MIGYRLPEPIRDAGANVLELAAYLAALAAAVTAVLTAYVKLRDASPAAARLVSMPLRILGRLVALSWSGPRWVWRKLWADDNGHPRGPMRRLATAAQAWVAAIVRAVTDPQFETVKANAKTQHDEQNQLMGDGFRAVGERLDGIDGRLDRGAQQIAINTADIATLKGNRPPTARQRATDFQEDGT